MSKIFLLSFICRFEKYDDENKDDEKIKRKQD